ncbi:gliding motility-associated C-terminal domain-containing protein [uncultured Pontibacter sp.]|uniref:T9SS type B sorting domain-containing protein n=1 Tax=uncultured Pontibacter sp. TaxID=453356 RepID=UPI002634AE26|nr:gliding motility-associated C-terminal domain-containing protein [uncultured Pontibacter sp.]
MKYILTIWFLILAVTSWAQQGCFHAIQDGQEVQVICANKPVFFRNCSPPAPTTTIFYYPGPEKYSTQTNILAGEQATTYTAPGTYIVTQAINENNGNQTQLFEKTYTVKAAQAAPAFTATACANNAISVTITGATYDSYTIDFGDGTNLAGQPNVPVAHTYADAGSYTITVTGRYTGSACSATETKQVTTLAAYKQPYIQNLLVRQQGETGEIQFDLQALQTGYMYIIERWQDPRVNFQKLDTIRNVSQSNISYTLRNVNTAEGVWYLIRVADACGSTISSSNSNIISSIALEATAGNEQATLTWSAMPGATQYEVYRNNTRIATLNSNITTYTDQGLSCGQNYTYYIKGIGADGSTSTSAQQNVQVTSSTIPAAPSMVASFNLNNEVELSISLPQNKVAQKADIRRSINGAAFQNLASVQQLQYTDALTPLQPVCYNVTYTDPCNNTSEVSSSVCPIILRATRQADGAIELTWTPYIGFPAGVQQYTVELLDESGNVAFYYVATGTTFSDRTLSDKIQVLRYRIRAISNAGSEVTYSNTVEFEQDLELYIPSAFTPNNDGLNDVFEIKGRFIQGYNLKIYNSLGNVIFTSDGSSTNWDGSYNGKQLPAGAYAYEITVKTNFGTTKRRTGTITLLR